MQGRFQYVTCRIALILACLWVDVPAMKVLVFNLLDTLVCAKVASTTCHTCHNTPSQRVTKQSCTDTFCSITQEDATAYIQSRFTCQ